MISDVDTEMRAVTKSLLLYYGYSLCLVAKGEPTSMYVGKHSFL